jgi:putative lipoprotein
MKAIVGFGFFLLFLAGIALVTLQGRQMAQQNVLGGGAALTGINWRPITLGNEAIPEDSGIFVSFAVDGGIKGRGGCNNFFGSLEQTESGIQIGPLGVTRMACPPPIMNRESAFLEALQKTRGFQTNDESMRLLDDEGSVLAEFVAGAE